jgi:hypothetical protein
MIDRKNKKLILICGVPHSGTTLLGLILGSHEDCFYGGEFNNILYFNNNNIPPDKRYCRTCGPTCPIWNQFNLESKLDVYEQLTRITGKSIIIDSTKNINWLTQQISNLKSEPVNLFLIYLMRDGRAVVNSLMRKYSDKDPKEIILDWKVHVEKTNSLFINFEGSKMKLHYEALALNPSEIIEKICNFLGLNFEPYMVQFYLKEHHPIGGNLGTQYLLIKAMSPSTENVPWKLAERHQHYITHPLDISLDLRWKVELSPMIIKIFNDSVGNLNNELEWNS